jgi:hypothetical protein
MIIRSRTMNQWMKANFNTDELRDIARHGAGTGWPRLTYYTDTTKLYDKFADEIWEALWSDTQDFGYDSVYKLLGTFNANHMPATDAQFKNQLVWYLAERIAQESDNEE